MATLNTGRLKSAMISGFRYFKGCTSTFDLYSDETALGHVDLSSLYGTNATLEVAAFARGSVTLTLTVDKYISVPLDFNAMPRNRMFFSYGGSKFSHMNALAKETDLRLLLQAYATYMQSGDFYKLIKG